MRFRFSYAQQCSQCHELPFASNREILRQRSLIGRLNGNPHRIHFNTIWRIHANVRTSYAVCLPLQLKHPRLFVLDWIACPCRRMVGETVSPTNIASTWSIEFPRNACNYVKRIMCIGCRDTVGEWDRGRDRKREGGERERERERQRESLEKSRRRNSPDREPQEGHKDFMISKIQGWRKVFGSCLTFFSRNGQSCARVSCDQQREPSTSLEGIHQCVNFLPSVCSRCSDVVSLCSQNFFPSSVYSMYSSLRDWTPVEFQSFISSVFRPVIIAACV